MREKETRAMYVLEGWDELPLKFCSHSIEFSPTLLPSADEIEAEREDEQTNGKKRRQPLSKRVCL